MPADGQMDMPPYSVALLELERRKRVRAEQTENFGEIEILPGEEISEKDLNGEFGDGPIFE